MSKQPSRGTDYSGSDTIIGTDFQVTWYNVTGTTASGKYTQDGATVAVDPTVIPLGSILELTFPDGRVYRRVAHDTGSAVKGRIVDVYADEATSELKRRGRTHGVTVRLLRKGW